MPRPMSAPDSLAATMVPLHLCQATASDTSPRKHRACDECRARKLACSKEPGGCNRCRSEGIPCHYSPQKPMGRPRKRRHVDGCSSADALPVPPSAVPVQVAASQALAGLVAEPASSAEATLDFFGPDGRSSTAFLDLLPAGFGDDRVDDVYSLEPCAQARLPGEDGQLFGGTAFPSLFVGADFLQDANLLDRPGSAETAAPKQVQGSSNPLPVSHQSSFPEYPLSCSSSDLAESPDASPRGTVKAMPSISCGCLSSLYLALESLAHLPSDVTSAMRVARSACKVAHDVVECRHCSNAFFDDPLKPPPIQLFQNLMFLGALVPSACNTYASILERVDDETASAAREGRTLFFSLRDAGGFWGSVTDDGDGHGSVVQSLDNKRLEPEVWRKAIRAVLKMDVYGLGDGPTTSLPPFPRRKGLQDVLTRLDQTSRRRHELMDELNASGQVPRHSPYLMSPLNQPSCPPEQRNCVRIIETARMALDRLVIA